MTESTDYHGRDHGTDYDSDDAADTRPGNQPRPLRLDRANRKILGVCAGLARYLDVPPALVRIIYCIACIVSPVLVIAYLVVYWLLQDDSRAARIQASINRTIKSGGTHSQSAHRRSAYRKRHRNAPRDDSDEDAVYESANAGTDPDAGMEEDMYASNSYETDPNDPLYQDGPEAREGFRINKPLYRSRRNVRLAGVCAGLANYLGVSTFFVRLATLLSLFVLGPVAFWTYVVLWIVLDKEPKIERKRKGKQGNAAQQRRHAAEDAASREQRKQDIEDCLSELKATDQRLQQVEAFMTSKQFRLHCEINRI